jgi:hypothetical protein
MHPMAWHGSTKGGLLCITLCFASTCHAAAGQSLKPPHIKLGASKQVTAAAQGYLGQAGRHVLAGGTSAGI